MEDRFKDKSCKDINISQSAKDFIIKALTKDAKSRPSAEELLQHEFITSNSPVEVVSSENKKKMVENIRTFS